nr:F-box only protein 8-like [Ipomoea batatas]
MEGLAIGRKIDLSLYNSYQVLTNDLINMFARYEDQECGKNGGEYALLYQDKQGNWLDIRWVCSQDRNTKEWGLKVEDKANYEIGEEFYRRSRTTQKTFKKMDATTSIASLPHEIILKIFTTLPPKSAVSFRCTSKFFYSSIPKPHFAFTIIFSFPSATHPTNLYTVGYTEESQGRLQATSLQCSEELHRFKGLASSSFADGKLCLLNTHGEITLWDLSTSQHISLPRTQPTLVGLGCGGPTDPQARLQSSRVLGFIDPVSKRYKVLKLELYRNAQHHWQGMLRYLTLGVDQSWRSVPINYYIPGKPIASVQIDGIIYFIHCKINCEDKQEIVEFDIETGNLMVIRFPYVFQRSCALPKMIYSSWVKLNDRLAYIYVHVDGLRTNIFVCAWEKSMRWKMHKVVALTLEECKIFSQAESVSITTNGIEEIVFLIRAWRMPPTILIYACGREVWRKFKICTLNDYVLAGENLRSFVHVIEEKMYFSE